MYETRKDDTLANISRQVYGNENQTQLIKDSNPNLGDTLSPNTTLITPKNANNPINKTQLVNLENNKLVTMLINGKQFKYFLRLNITQSIDKISFAEFDAPMESDRKEFREIFKPFSFQDLQVFIGNELIFTGTIIDIIPSVNNDDRTVSISAYAKCGVLNDVTPSSNQLEKLEFNNVKLSTIANSLIAPFGVKAIFKNDEGAVFEQVAIESDGNILQFLADLANKRELVISSDVNGDLLFQKAITQGESVSSLQQGQTPVQDINPSFNSQNYFSHITGIEPVDVGGDGSKYTIANEFLKNSFRPYVFRIEDTESADIKKAVSMKFGKMLGEMVSYDINVIDWIDESGNLFKPNTFINLKAEDSMIYNSFKFLVKSVSFSEMYDSRMTTLNLVLPESYSGQIPKALPWQE